MVAFNIREFRGMSQKVSPRSLPEGMAQSAENVDFGRGSLRPVHDSVASSQSVSYGTLTANTETLYLTSNSNQHLLAFDNDVDVVESPIADDQYDRVYWTGNTTYPQITSSPYNNIYKLALDTPSAPSIGLNPSTSANVASENPVSRAYVATFVTAFGEESKPSPVTPNDIKDVYTDQTITVTAGAAPATRNYAYIRIYRTDEDGVFRFLHQYSNTSGGSFIDSFADTVLQEEVPSIDWDPPDNDMIGLTSMANGITAGFFGQTLCFSEAYLPHAWPEEYRLTTAYDIVGLARMDTGLLVLTKGKPYMVQGADPAGLTITELDVAQSCVAKKSIVEMGPSAIYASPDGLVGINSTGARVLTDPIFNKFQWDSYNPSDIKGVRWEDRYLAFTDRGGSYPEGFVFDPRGGMDAFCDINISSDIIASFNYLKTDSVYVLDSSANLKTWATDSDDWVPYTYKTKEFFTARPVNFGVCQVAFGEDLDATSTTFKVLAGSNSANSLIHTETIAASTDVATFRLPSGTKYNVFAVEVISEREITSIALAESSSELR